MSDTQPNAEKPAKRIAVTGGSGAIGTYVCDELLKASHDVYSVDLAAPRIDVGFIKADLTHLENAREAIAGFDQVVHLAAIPDPYGGDPPERVIGVNTVVSYNIFEAARLENVKRVIYGCMEILKAYCGTFPPFRDRAYFDDNPYASIFDIRKAERLLGWEPQLDWHDFEQWEL